MKLEVIHVKRYSNNHNSAAVIHCSILDVTDNELSFLEWRIAAN